VIEDMLRMYVMDKRSKCEDYMHLIEFSYNNEYQTSLNMSPFEALYGRKCKMQVRWDNLADKVVVGPELFKKMKERMTNIKKNLKVSHDTQKSYEEKGRTHLEFRVGEHILLKVKAKKSSLRLGRC